LLANTRIAISDTAVIQTVQPKTQCTHHTDELHSSAPLVWRQSIWPSTKSCY